MDSWLRFFKRPPLRAISKPGAARWPLLVGVVLAIWLSFFLYTETLGIPFLQEDSTHIRWLSWHNLFEPFLTARGAPDYRPLGKSIIKLWYLILGRHDRIWLRYHNIAFNTLNIAFVAVLASWLDTSKRRYWTAGIAALLFGTFPFAYQAIPWINNFFYPLANLLLLAMTAVYWQARVRRSNPLLLAAFVLLFLAPFEIEYGLMGSGLLLLVELSLWLQKRQPYPWLTGPAIGLLLNVLFLIRSLTIPKQSYSFGLPTPGRLLLIATYFLQGLMYPISPLAIWVMDVTGWGDVTAIWTVSLPVLVVLLVVLWRKKQVGLLLLGLGWFLLLNLPAFVFVDFDYVVNSPRLLYPPAVGIVLLWGAFLAILAVSQKLRYASVILAAAFLLITLGLSIRFVRERSVQYRLAERPVLQLAEIARQTDPQEELLIVNFPSWLSPRQRRFAMGNHGVQIIPFYVNIQELIYAHNDADQAARAIQFGNIRQPQDYYYGMLGEQVDYEKLGAYLDNGGPVYLTEWSADQIDLRAVGFVSQQPLDPQKETYQFGNNIQLQLSEIAINDESLAVSLLWHLSEPLPEDMTVFVHLYAPDGQLIGQADGYPIAGLAPFWLWTEPKTIADNRVIALEGNTLDDGYRLGVGVYDPVSGERLPAVDGNGHPLADNLVLFPITAGQISD